LNDAEGLLFHLANFRFGLSQWPLYSDKPTLNIDALQHHIGMALITAQEA
jgi:hypothetical protein